MFAEIVFVLIGLAILLVAGDFLVRGAVGLAAALGVPALIVSLTIVAFGTSAPELVVTVQSVLSGNDGIAIGNIIGSNIANIFLVLGLPAIIYPISTHVRGLRRHMVFMLLATAMFAGVAYKVGQINFEIGGAFFAGILVYVAYMWVRASIGKSTEPVLDEVEEYQSATGLNLQTVGFLFIGLIGLPVGAHLGLPLLEKPDGIGAAIGLRAFTVLLAAVAELDVPDLDLAAHRATAVFTPRAAASEARPRRAKDFPESAIPFRHLSCPSSSIVSSVPPGTTR